MSAKALTHGWKHEAQVVLMRRRAAMTPAVLPKHVGAGTMGSWTELRATGHELHRYEGGDDDADTGR